MPPIAPNPRNPPESYTLDPDLYVGSFSTDGWTSDNAGSDPLFRRAAGSLTIFPGATQAGFGAYPNRTPGPRLYQSVTGDFDLRCRFRLLNSSGDAATDSFFGAYLLVSEVASAASNCIDVGMLLNNPAPLLRWSRHSTSSSGADLGENSTPTPLAARGDVRIVRTGQLFSLQYRDYDGSALSSNTGWTVWIVLDRTANPMPTTLFCGPAIRSTTSGLANIAMFEEFLGFPVTNTIGPTWTNIGPYDDNFTDSPLNPKWTSNAAGTTATFTVSGGDLRIDPQDATGTGLTASPNRAPGPRVYQSVTGDFDARIRVWIRDNTDTADASVSQVTAGLLASSTATGVGDWIAIEQGFESGAVQRYAYNTPASGAFVLSSASQGSLHADLRIVRRGQFFDIYRRNYSVSVALRDDSGWTLVTTYDRTLTNTLPSTLLVGPVLRATAAGATASLIRVEEFRLVSVSFPGHRRTSASFQYTPGEIAQGFTAFPNRTPGPRSYLSVTGDFDARARVWLRDSAGTGDPPSNDFRFAGIYASATEAGSASWIQMVRGSANVSSPRVNGASATSAGASRFDNSSSSADTPFRGDLRMVRRGQFFLLQHRPYNPLVPLESDAGWFTLNGTAYDLTADPLPTTLLVGPMLRASGVDFANVQARVEEFTIFQATIVRNISEFETTWALTSQQNMILEDGTYSRIAHLSTSRGHIVRAKHGGSVIFDFGLTWGGAVAGGGGIVQGIRFNVQEVSRCDPLGENATSLQRAIVLGWGVSSANLQVLDCYFDGNDALLSPTIGYGVRSVVPDGTTVRRCEFRNLQEMGVWAMQTSAVGARFANDIVVEDVLVDNILRPSAPGSSIGEGENGLMIGHNAQIRRLYIRNIAISGLVIGNSATRVTIEDIDVDYCGVQAADPVYVDGVTLGALGVGIYVERGHSVSINRVHCGRYITGRGINVEWDQGGPNPYTDQNPPRNTHVSINNAFIEAYKIGIHMDRGVSWCAIQNVHIERAWRAGILDNNQFPDDTGSFPTPVGYDPIFTTNVVDQTTCTFRLGAGVPHYQRDFHGGFLTLPPVGWPLNPDDYDELTLGVETFEQDLILRDAVAPNVTFTPASGGALGLNQPVVMDVTDNSGSLTLVIITVTFFRDGSPLGAPEVIFDTDGLTSLYSASIQTPITNGFRFTIQRSGGWVPGTQPVFKVIPLDARDN